MQVLGYNFHIHKSKSTSSTTGVDSALAVPQVCARADRLRARQLVGFRAVVDPCVTGFLYDAITTVLLIHSTETCNL